MPKDDDIWLKHMLDAAHEAVQFAHDRNYTHFSCISPKTRYNEHVICFTYNFDMGLILPQK